ncbi:transglycosylase domain-containing protein, partial [Staphylococcus saprophyticus]|uniref:transglycosylase domain-containing protein n=1 Tax=Staphylococcus saprophyticus TaxID=29385 RepID=UPI003704C74E
MQDQPFYKHHRFHLKATSPPLFSTFTHKTLQPPTTITQQLLKNYYYHNQHSITTKIKHFFVPHTLHKQYHKNQILSFY